MFGSYLDTSNVWESAAKSLVGIMPYLPLFTFLPLSVCLSATSLQGRICEMEEAEAPFFCLFALKVARI